MAKPTADEFKEALLINEDMMAEHAAMAATCESYGIEEDEGYTLLMEAGEQ